MLIKTRRYELEISVCRYGLSEIYLRLPVFGELYWNLLNWKEIVRN